VAPASLPSEASEESSREDEAEIKPAVSAELANDHDWHAILASLNIGGMARELGQHCELLKVGANRVFLRLSPTHRHLQIKPAQDKLQQALSEYLGRPVQLSVDLEEIVGDTPAAVAQRVRRERQDQAVASVERDEFVREVIDIFDATLIESSIKPV
jgi:DNA polymerase-3 subunit gamma/tau